MKILGENGPELEPLESPRPRRSKLSQSGSGRDHSGGDAINDEQVELLRLIVEELMEMKALMRDSHSPHMTGLLSGAAEAGAGASIAAAERAERMALKAKAASDHLAQLVLGPSVDQAASAEHPATMGRDDPLITTEMVREGCREMPVDEDYILSEATRDVFARMMNVVLSHPELAIQYQRLLAESLRRD